MLTTAYEKRSDRTSSDVSQDQNVTEYVLTVHFYIDTSREVTERSDEARMGRDATLLEQISSFLKGSRDLDRSEC